MPFIRILASDWRVMAHSVVRLGGLQIDNWPMQVMRPAYEPPNPAFVSGSIGRDDCQKWLLLPCVIGYRAGNTCRGVGVVWGTTFKRGSVAALPLPFKEKRSSHLLYNGTLL